MAPSMKKAEKASKTSMKKKSAMKSGMKRKMNEYFTLMLKAKKEKATSFQYNGNTYVGKPHEKLGMVYKKK